MTRDVSLALARTYGGYSRHVQLKYTKPCRNAWSSPGQQQNCRYTSNMNAAPTRSQTPLVLLPTLQRACHGAVLDSFYFAYEQHTTTVLYLAVSEVQ